MPRIFISYRREDSQHQADRLHAILKRHVANPKRDIFIDVDNIPVGVDFVEHLDQQVGKCDVLLALIGPDWLDIKSPKTGARRLDDPSDFVRIEIASALRRGIPVAPVLLDGAPFPDLDQLPEDLRPLARRNGVEIRRMTFEADTERLVRGLMQAPPASQPQARAKPAQPAAPSAAGRSSAAETKKFPAATIAGTGVVALLAALGLFFAPGLLGTTAPKPPTTVVADQTDAAAERSAAPMEVATATTPAPSSLSAEVKPESTGAPASPIAPAAAATSAGSAKQDPPAAPAVPTLMLQPLRTFSSGSAGSVPSFTPDGALLVSPAPEQGMQIWNVVSGALMATLPCRGSEPLISPDGKRMMAPCGFDGVVRVWELPSGKLITSFSHGNRALVQYAAFSRDGLRVISSAHGERSAKVWDATTGKLLLTLDHPITGADASVYDVRFSSDGSRVVTIASGDEIAVWIWDSKSGQQLHKITGERALAISQSGDLVFSAVDRANVRIYSTSTGEPLSKLKTNGRGLWGQGNNNGGSLFSNDDKTLLTFSDYGNGKVWDPRTGNLLASLSGDGGLLYRAVMSADGKHIVTCGHIWETRTGKIEATFDAMTCERAALSPDGSVLAVVARGNKPITLHRVTAR